MAGESDLAQQLSPARLPADFFAVSAQDLLAAFGIGILVAVALYFMLRPFARRRTSALVRVTRQLEAFRRLPPQERVFRQVATLDELRRHFETKDAGKKGAGQNDGPRIDADVLPPDLKEALYRPDVAVDHDALDARILRIAERVKS